MNSRFINLDSTAIKLVSFDVFDTVITRKCGAPRTIFRIVGEKLRKQGFLTISPRAFERMRWEAERRTRQHRGNAEITLWEIYAELNRLWLFSATTVRDMMNLELETERENIFAIPGAQALIEQARGAGKRVAFVSDMYLSQDFLREILVELGLMKEGDGLYVSSHWGASKANGRLFPILLEQEKLKGKEVLHLGDSPHADVKRAREQGMRARQVARGSLNRFENALAQSEAEISETVGTLAGLARQARLGADETGAHFVAARLGASVAGPLLTAYAEWVLRSALKRKLRRLYFLARDGQALMRLCEVLSPAVGAEGIELRYLYGSRETWSPAALVKLDEAAAAFFASHIAWTASTREQGIEHLGFSMEEINHTSLREKWTAGERPAGAAWKKQIFRDVISDPALARLLKRRLEKKVSLAARYLREQGLADGVPSGLVDCGWSGTWTDILGGLIEAQAGKKPLVFFLGRRKRPGPERCETLAWMFDHQAAGGLKHIPDYFHVVAEFFLTADHGRTVGFEEADGRLRPVLAAVDWQGFEPESWRVFRAAMLGYATEYARQLQPVVEANDLRTVLNELLVQFWEKPTVEEARFFAGHTIGLSPSRANTNPLARAYGAGDAVRLLMRGKLPGYPPFWWHEGALALSGAGTRAGMALMWEMRELVRALIFERKDARERKGLIQSLVTSARKLKHACTRREDSDFYRFEIAGGPSKGEAKPLNSLVTGSRQTTV